MASPTEDVTDRDCALEYHAQTTRTGLSARAGLYQNINDSLDEDDVRSLRVTLVTEGHLGKARVEKATPQEIFSMLEDDKKIGSGNLGLIVNLLKQLKKSKLADKAEAVERDERDEIEAQQKERYSMTSHNQLNTEQETQSEGDFQQGLTGKSKLYQEWCNKQSSNEALGQKDVKGRYPKAYYKTAGGEQQTVEQEIQELKDRIEKAAEILLGRSVTISGFPEHNIHEESAGALPLSVTATSQNQRAGSFEGSSETDQPKFHPIVHGTNIHIESNGTTARSRDSNSICFSKMPIKVGEKINLKIVESRMSGEFMKFGFFSKDPDSMTMEQIPPQSNPDLAQQPGFWVKPLPASLVHQGSVVTFTLEDSGDVTFAINGEDRGLFFSGVDASKPLWAVVDVHGSATALQFVDWQAVCQVKDRCIHEGDQVQLCVEQKDTFRALQRGHGEFNPDMEKAIGEVGIVLRIDDDGDMHVFFPSVSRRWCINPAALQKVIRPDVRSKAFLKGDMVMITTDLENLKRVQKEKRLWLDSMEKTLGKVGRVRGVLPDGDIGVRVEGEDSDWIFNPQVIEKIEIQRDMCDLGLHNWKEGFSRVCVKCGECTSEGASCSMKGKPHRSPRSCCGCANRDAGCEDCGLCKSCSGEGSDKMLDQLKHLLEGLRGDEPNEHGLKKGDQVQVNVDNDTFERLQHENGLPWNENMVKVIGVPGTITSLLFENDVLVHFENNERGIIFSGCLTKIFSGAQDKKEPFNKGDLVSLTTDNEKLKALQKGHGGYVEVMKDCLGKTGCVEKVQRGRARVNFLHVPIPWWFNCAALNKVSTADKQETVHLLKTGDCVKVTVDAETFKANQVCHGGGVEHLVQLMETAGAVRYIDRDGDAFICFLNGKRHLINPASLDKVNPDDIKQDDSSELEQGDLVKVDADKAFIRKAQKATGRINWDSGYYTTAGKVGVVKKFNPSNKIAHVSIHNAVFPLNSKLVKRATLSDLQKDFGRIRQSHFARGDPVKIAVDLKLLQDLQKGHGGYKVDMEKLQKLGEVGTVCFIDYEGDVCVRFNLGGMLCFNSAALCKVTTVKDTFQVGDLVQVESDPERFKALQTEEHGGYLDEMNKLCGETGRLLTIVDDKKIGVKVHGRKWFLNKDLLRSKGSPRDATAEWKSATICAPGKHDWSFGWTLVCVVCGECTDHGKLCHASGNPDRTPGSVTGCGDGMAGCDDCGCCLSCAKEEKAKQEVAVNKSKTLVEKHRLSEFSGELEAQRKRLLPVFEQLSQCIELITTTKDLDSIEEVLYALSQVSTSWGNQTDLKQAGDYLSNIGAAEAFMEYASFLSSQVGKRADMDKTLSDCLRLLFGVVNTCAYRSIEFGYAVGRTGLLQMTACELARCMDMEESEVNQKSRQNLLSILGNCARVPENLDYFRDMEAVDLLKKCLKDEQMPFKVTAVSCLAHFVDAQELDLIKMQAEDVDFFVKKLNEALGNVKHECQSFETYCWAVSKLVIDLVSLARHDSNKHEFVKNGVMEPLTQLIESGDDTEKECAMLCLQRFAVVDDIRETILSESRVEQVLRALLLQQSQIYAVQIAARKTLKCLGK